MTINKHSLEKSGMVPVEGGDIHYRLYVPHDAEAATRTPLIVAHGGPGGCHIGLYDAMSPLANDRPVLFYDQLGSYCSPADMTEDLMTVARFAEEPRFLMAALSMDKAVFLGHSWGSVIAVEFFMNHPEKIAGLILSSPLLSTRRWVDDCNRLLAAMPQDVQDTIRTCEAEGTTKSDAYSEADRAFSERHYRRSDLNHPAIKTRKNMHIYNTMWGPSEFSHSGTLGNLDLFPRLHRINVPTLLLCGVYDTATPEAMKDAQDAIGSNAQIAILPNAGHATFIDANDGYVNAVGGFLAQTVDRRPHHDANLKTAAKAGCCP